MAAHSSGAICTLGAALRGMPVAGLVLYEPPWPVGESNPGMTRIGEVEELIRRGERDAALELALRVLVDADAETVAEIRATSGWATRTALVHTWPREVWEIDKLPRTVEGLRRITIPTLLLLGETTSQRLADATAAIAHNLPDAKVVNLAGQGHAALALAPQLVANAIRAWSVPSS